MHASGAGGGTLEGGGCGGMTSEVGGAVTSIEASLAASGPASTLVRAAEVEHALNDPKNSATRTLRMTEKYHGPIA